VLEEHECGVLRPRIQRSRDRIGDQPKAVVLAARRAGARMDDDPHQPEGLGPVELVEKRLE